MTNSSSQKPRSLIFNLTSLVGIVLASCGFIFGVILIGLDMHSHFENPYVGIFTYMVVPAVLITGLLLIVTGMFRERRRRHRKGATTRPPLPKVDLNYPPHFAAVVVTIVVSCVFIVLSAVGGYRAFHFTESEQFCGLTCHKVMKPEHVAHANSPHANVSCAACHIGPGADWFVKSKMSGLRQVVATAADSYHRPIKTPIENLRPAQETCYQCHWPAKFHGAMEQTRTYFRTDEGNSPWTIQLLLKVGGGNPAYGPQNGIHWHMSVSQKIEYLATDEKRQVIPWMRITARDGKVTVFKTDDFKMTDEQIAAAGPRVMDCIDCHNRPSHRFESPDEALNTSLAVGAIDPKIPFIKRNAALALLGEYATEDQALAAIRTQLAAAYPAAGATLEAAIKETQRIYKDNFFPEMKVRWDAYPDNIGHRIWPGCFRCHDGEHKNAEGAVVSRECNSCHTIIAQGEGTQVAGISTAGLEFVHPYGADEDAARDMLCSECHNGKPSME